MIDDATTQPTVQDLINTCIGEKPDEFASRFNELMRDRLAAAVNTKKTELSSALFGTPEGQTDIDDTITQARDDVTDPDEDQETEENTDDV